MGVLQSAASAVGQAVSDVAADVKDGVVGAATDSVKQIAKTPLDILEELLGSSGAGGGANEQKSEEEQGASSPANKAAIAQKNAQDDAFKVQQHQELHQKIMQQSQGYYEQKKQADEQQRQISEQQKEQEKFQIKQLEKQKSHDYALQAAKDASSAEKRMGAG